MLIYAASAKQSRAEVPALAQRSATQISVKCVKPRRVAARANAPQSAIPINARTVKPSCGSSVRAVRRFKIQTPVELAKARRSKGLCLILVGRIVFEDKLVSDASEDCANQGCEPEDPELSHGGASLGENRRSCATRRVDG